MCVIGERERGGGTSDVRFHYMFRVLLCQILCQKTIYIYFPCLCCCCCCSSSCHDLILLALGTVNRHTQLIGSKRAEIVLL